MGTSSCSVTSTSSETLWTQTLSPMPHPPSRVRSNLLGTFRVLLTRPRSQQALSPTQISRPLQQSTVERFSGTSALTPQHHLPKGISGFAPYPSQGAVRLLTMVRAFRCTSTTQRGLPPTPGTSLVALRTMRGWVLLPYRLQAYHPMRGSPHIQLTPIWISHEQVTTSSRPSA